MKREKLSGGRALLGYGIYPGVLLGALLSCWLLLENGVSVFWASGLVVAGVALLTFLLECVFPFSSDWRTSANEARVDAIHSLVGAGVVAPLVRALLIATVAAAGAALSAKLGQQLWPVSWPVPAQLALAILIGDLGAYWGHRLMHLTRTGWRVHAVHHSPTRLDIFAAGRSHPFNAFWVLSLEGVVVVLLGITPAVWVLMSVFKAANGLLQHANVDMRPGALSYVLTTCDAHRWHHSVVPEESNRNFGNTTMVWDQVFGTFYLPKDRDAGSTVGIDGAEIPETYLTHLATPFVLSRYERG